MQRTYLFLCINKIALGSSTLVFAKPIFIQNNQYLELSKLKILGVTILPAYKANGQAH